MNNQTQQISPEMNLSDEVMRALQQQTNHLNDFFKALPASGAFRAETSIPPIEYFLNSIYSPNIANNRYEYIGGVLSRLGNPAKQKEIIQDANLQNVDPFTMSVIDDLAKITLDYTSPAEGQAKIRSFLLSGMMTQDNMDLLNGVGSGDSLQDMRRIIKSMQPFLTMLGKMPYFKQGFQSKLVLNLLAKVKASGSMEEYTFLLELFNTLETTAVVAEIFSKLSLAEERILGGSLVQTATPNSTTGGVFQQSGNLFAGKTMDQINQEVSSLAVTMFDNLVQSAVQQNQLRQDLIPVYQKLKELALLNPSQWLNMECTNVFLHLFQNKLNASHFQADLAAIQEALKLVFCSEMYQTHHTIKTEPIALTYFAVKLQLFALSLQQTQPEISNFIQQGVSVLLHVILGGFRIDPSNGQQYITMSECMRADILAGTNFITRAFYPTEMIHVVSDTLFVPNIIDREPMLSKRKIIARTQTTGPISPNTNIAITQRDVRTYLETIPQIKPYLPLPEFLEVEGAMVDALNRV